MSLLFFPSVSFSQNVSGNVKDLHFNIPLEEVAVIVKDNLNGEIVGTDSTDAIGNYSIDYFKFSYCIHFIILISPLCLVWFQ